ncbi:MAG: hypothetical protein ACP5FK_08380 [bacterium]
MVLGIMVREQTLDHLSSGFDYIVRFSYLSISDDIKEIDQYDFPATY